MGGITIGGKTFRVPGVYGTTEVINVGNVTLPAFNNILFIGGAKKGIPYNATGKTGADKIKSFSSITDAKKYFGVSDLTKAFAYAKLGGAGTAFFINVANLTKASCIIKDNDGAPANTFSLTPVDEFYGAAGNDISLTVATANNLITFTIIAPKTTKFLSANADVASYELFLDDVEGLYVNQSVKLVDNDDTTPQATTITAVDSVNSRITIADLPDTAFATAKYGRLFIEDTDNQKVKAFADTVTINEVLEWINESGIVIAARGSYTGLVPTTLAKTYLQNVASAVKGTSPAATETVGGDFDLFAESAAQIIEEFSNDTKIRLRLLNLLSSDSAVHAVYIALANSMRNEMQYSIQIITGSALGDIDLATSNAGNPISRAKSANNSDFILAGMGIDSKAAYMSLAPYVAGIMSANSVKRNLTSDVITAITVEKLFGKSNVAEQEAYLNNGVLIVGSGKDGKYIVQGVNTYQNQDTIWNADDDTSYLIQQVQLRDYVFEAYASQMGSGVGADVYTPTTARVKGLGILKTLFDGGFLTAYKMLRAWKEANSVKTKPSVKLLQGNDFVGFELTIDASD